MSDARARVTSVAIMAASAAEARQQALQMRYVPLAVKPQRASAAWWDRLDIDLFAEELRILVAAGITLVEAIEGLAEREERATPKRVLADLARQLREGAALSAAMERHPRSFPPLFVGVVRSAETTSDLPQALGKYLDYSSHLRTVRSRVTSASMYPCILLTAGAAVTLFMMVYVVPQFAAVYQNSGRVLPWGSRVLLEAGVFLKAQWPWLSLAAALATAVAWWRVSAVDPGQRWLALLRHAPGCRRAAHTIVLSRLYRTLAMLLAGGIVVREALRMAKPVVDPAQRGALDRARALVEGGQDCSQALADVGLCTPLALRMLRAGERSGSLAEMLARTAQFHEHETSVWVERLSSVVAPLFMVAVSLVIGVVVWFLYAPIFSASGALR
ncbi:MAG: type II secretion system F family protein [Rubrivivax sp.]|nr:type II secretion system F family protein [Rubrivivax sp.]